MQFFPMFIKVVGRRVVIAGGGEQAAQKARLMLKTEARIVLVAPYLEAELAALVASGRAEHDARRVSAERFADCAMVFVATGCPGLDAALHGLAKAAGALVNVVDQPGLCDIITPSIVDRDPVVVAIGTEGTAPVLARQIKTEIEMMLAPQLGGFAALAGRLRTAVAAHVPKARRREFWRWAFASTPRKKWEKGAERASAEALTSAIAKGGAPGDQAGSITLVGAGPGARDLLTLRAVRKLQEADVIFYDRLVDPDVLELARRDAERVFVGKVVGACAWPQERIDAVIVAAAREGKHVVRLKSGDPSIFGRSTEELAAGRREGLRVEVVPGVTAASAAAAAMEISLTERGVSDTLVLATGTCAPGAEAPDWARHARPGTRLVFYMAVRKAAEIRRNLIAQGLDPTSEIQVACSVETPRQRLLRTTLEDLPATLAREAISGQTVLMLTVPARTEAPRMRLVAAQ